MIKNKLKKIINNKKGFTIVESLFAIFILVISVTGPMAFTQSGLRAAYIARDQVTAFYLAQDAIEYVKNIRDDNSLIYIDDPANLGSGGWLTDLSPCFEGITDGCTIDTIDEEITECIDANHPGCFNGSDFNPLVRDGNGFFRTSEGVEDSIYVREIIIRPVPSGLDIDDPNLNEVEIDVVVKWKTPHTAGEKSINVKENMFNWAIGI